MFTCCRWSLVISIIITFTTQRGSLSVVVVKYVVIFIRFIVFADREVIRAGSARKSQDTA